MALILNPSVEFRKDSTRILIYKVNLENANCSDLSFIHPAYAILLTLFDGQTEYEEVLCAFCDLIGEGYTGETRQFIEKQLKSIEKDLLKIEHLLVEQSTLPPLLRTPRYLPEDVLLPFDQVDLDQSNQRVDFPLSMIFNVTTRCQMNCVYCYHPRYPMDEQISLERLKVIFDECVAKGCRSIALSGGDPFLRKDFIEIMEALAERGLLFFTSTKSYLDLETCRQLKDRARLSMLQISLDSADPALAAFMTGMDQGFLGRVVETIHNLHSVGIKVWVKAVLTSYNIDTLAEYLEFCRGLNVYQVDLALYRRSIWHHHDKLFATEAQIDHANAVIADFVAKYGDTMLKPATLKPDYLSHGKIPLNSPIEEILVNRGSCEACRSGLTIIPNGEVIVCEHLPYVPEVVLGDLKQQSVAEIWNSPQMQNFLTPPPRARFSTDAPCRSCPDQAYEFCHRNLSICLKNSYLYYGNLHSPDINCNLVQIENFRLK